VSGRTLVVGGGIAGAAVALALRRRGREVSVLDAGERGAVGPGPQATGASAGMLAPRYELAGPGPLFDLGVASRRRHPAFLRRLESLAGVDVGLREEGMLVPAFTGEEADAEADAARAAGSGAAARILSGGDAAALQPGLTLEARCWTWVPGEACLDTQRLAAALGPALEAAGAELRAPAPVRALRTGGRRVRGVELEDGSAVDGDAVVLAAGAWSGRLDGLPRPVPVRPVRGQMLRYAADGAPPLRRLVADRGGRYLVPRPDGSLLAGSTMEEAGFEGTTTEEGRRGIARGAVRLLPALAGCPVDEAWAGLRPLSADGAPILGPDPEVRGLHYATGYGRNGILLAPEAGEIVAALIAGERPPSDPGPFGIGRFGEG